MKEVEALLTIENNTQQKDEVIENYLPLVVKNRLEKCFYHIENLNFLWKDVLPLIVFKRGIGQIMNAFYAKLLTVLVQNWGEYSQVLNEHLQDILDSAVKLSKYLFDEKEVIQFIPVWSKIEAITRILASSLTDIETECSNSAGDIGLIFEHVEIKQLLKIMFPHTSNREAVLNKIVV